MKKLFCIALAALLLLTSLAACTSGNEEGKETNPTEGTKAPATDAPSQTEAPAQTQVPIETQSEEELYFYNPRLQKCYRKDEKTVLFTVDTKVKDPDGNLATHIYAAATADGEAISKAVSAVPYEGALSTLWGVTFDTALPDSFFLCFRDKNAKKPKSGDLDSVLCDAVDFGIYGATKLADGTRVAAIQNGSEVIEATLWVEAKINFQQECDVTYCLPDEGRDVLLLHEADMKSVLLAAFSGPGAYVEFTFEGTGINAYSEIENDSVTSDLEIYLDGEFMETVDNRTGFNFLKEGLKAGEHTIKLVAGDNSTSVSAIQADPTANKDMFYISGIRYTAE